MVGTGNKDIINAISQYTPEGYCHAGDIVVDKAKGSYFTDIEGKQYLDFSSGIFTNTFGHCFAPLMEAEKKQLSKFDNIHARKSLAELDFYQELSTFMPLPDYKFIPYNDGGYAVDRALSDIINYYNKERIPIGAFKGGFHGKTMGTKLTINETAHAALFDNFQIDFPHCYRCPWQKKPDTCRLCCVKEICQRLKEKQAKAIIFEIIQGSGIIIPPQGFWQEIADFCIKNKIVMFSDEVLTGGGRTGHFLAGYGLYNITADVISVTKGLANGRPLSVLCQREYITNNPYAKRTGERSSTFAAHAINLAVAAENLRCLKKYHIFENVRHQGEVLSENLNRLKAKYNEIGDVRSIGLMAAIEFVKSPLSKEPNGEFAQKVFYKARSLGLELISSGHILRIAPPLNINTEDLLKGIDVISKSIQEVKKED